MKNILPTYNKEEDKESLWLKNDNSFRMLIGILGMALPVLLFLFLWIDTDYTNVLPSISHYYFTRANSVFIITVSLLATFLIIYTGKDFIDFIISAIAGIFALLLLLFPTYNLLGFNDCIIVTKLKVSPFREGFHNLSAAIFLGCLAYMSFFIFTKSHPDPQRKTEEKIIRNRIYRVCAVIMVLALLVILAHFIDTDIERCLFYEKNCLTFWMETVAIEAFGFSWMVKGEFILKDNSLKK